MHGTLESAEDGRWRLRYIRPLAHPPEKVWRAITEPEHISAWFPSDIVGDRAAGATLNFPFREEEGPTLTGEMRVYDPPRTLEFTWDADVLRFELEPRPEGCLLHFTVTMDERGRGVRDGSGWHYCLDHLQALLDGTALAQDGPERVVALQREYREKLGAEAATVAPPMGWDTGTS